MSAATAEAFALVHAHVRAAPGGTKLKFILPDIAKISGLSQRKIRSIWNEEPVRIDADELAGLQRLEAAPAVSPLIAEADSYDQLADRFEAIDADFNRKDVLHYRALAERLRRLAAGGRDAG